MSKERENKAVVERWFREFWGNPWNPRVVDELGTPDLLVHYPMHWPRRGRDEVKKFMSEFREAFPDLDFWGVGGMIAEGDYVVARWDGGGTHTGPAFSDLPVGSLPANSGKKIRFTGTTVMRIENGRVAEELGQEGALTAPSQLGLVSGLREKYAKSLIAIGRRACYGALAPSHGGNDQFAQKNSVRRKSHAHRRRSCR